MPDAAIKITSDAKQEAKTAIDVQNKIAIVSMDAVKHALNALSTNASEFASLNRNIIEMWLSMMPSRSS